MLNTWSLTTSDEKHTKETFLSESGALRKMTSVANRVQRLSFLGNETPEMASRRELFPYDWSPQTISWGSAVNSLRPFAQRESIRSRSWSCSTVLRFSIECNSWIDDMMRYLSKEQELRARWSIVDGHSLSWWCSFPPGVYHTRRLYSASCYYGASARTVGNYC